MWLYIPTPPYADAGWDIIGTILKNLKLLLDPCASFWSMEMIEYLRSGR
jgi:hypothetical protein